MKIYYLVFLILFSIIFARDVDLDSLSHQNNISILERSSYKLISYWQSISYKSNKLNCQFYPSCSNYYASATNQFGLLGGSIRGVDRFVRCNPAAVGYHLQDANSEFHNDGRLVDKLELPDSKPKNKSFKLPILLSAIPGLGRAYYGHRFDGFVSFTYVSGFSMLSSYSLKNGNDISGLFSCILALLFWSADIYAVNQYSPN